MTRHSKTSDRVDKNITDDEEHTPEEWKVIDERNIREIYEIDDPYWRGTWITKDQYKMLLDELAHSQHKAS